MLVNALPWVEQLDMKNMLLGCFEDKATMILSRDQTFKPSDKKSSQHKHQNRKHNIHVLLNSSSKNPKKRKLEQYINDGKFATSCKLINKEKYGSENVKYQKRNPSPHHSCSTLPGRKNIIVQETQEYGFPAQNDKTEFCGINMEDYSHLSDTNDSIKGPSIKNQGSLNIQARGLMPSISYSSSNKTSIEEKEKMEFLKILVEEAFINSKTSHLLYSKEADVKLIHSSKNFLPARSNHLPRPVIPVGPRFQAEIPKWEGTTNLKQYNSDDCLKWLGIQIWPMPNVSKTNAKGIGKGRHDSCSCHNPKSVDCVQKHVSEARECLKSKINTAFSNWKFDDMGEDVSKSWTMEEQTAFESLVKSNPLSSDTKFWKLKMKKYFPSKSMKCMINYYYNVYIPRCMSKATRSPFGAFDGEPK